MRRGGSNLVRPPRRPQQTLHRCVPDQLGRVS
eukprot:CAMPEP_0206457928 /NCGR_PEP_ID=MMETSP0324_2-20121206/23259_1 /ASSEMBLY_ACC=CAM_ASM_000836 /TAXON_ID=2866 /ORGANISM="Crypthecodinium cohnii, Strain Seligo" /LENGTH=31 /DNA_ID= /DNA_START= /DNA_END= /DNA_ORIENTATION=